MPRETKIKNLLFVLALAGVIAGAVVLYSVLSGGQAENTSAASQRMEQETITELQDTAADFTVTDSNGNAIRLAEKTGKPIVLNFWASWCGPCQSEMYDFQDIYENYGSRIELMMVNLTDGTSETQDTAAAYVAEHKLTFPVYFDTTGEAAKAYGIYSIPVTYFIDKNGNLAAQIIGATNSGTISGEIEKLLVE